MQKDWYAKNILSYDEIFYNCISRLKTFMGNKCFLLYYFIKYKGKLRHFSKSERDECRRYALPKMHFHRLFYTYIKIIFILRLKYVIMYFPRCRQKIIYHLLKTLGINSKCV